MATRGAIAMRNRRNDLRPMLVLSPAERRAQRQARHDFWSREYRHNRRLLWRSAMWWTVLFAAVAVVSYLIAGGKL